jgi:hypothetical protein
VTRGRRQRDGLTGGGAGRDPAVRRARTVDTASFGHALSGGAPTARWWRGSDSREALSASAFKG